MAASRASRVAAPSRLAVFGRKDRKLRARLVAFDPELGLGKVMAETYVLSRILAVSANEPFRVEEQVSNFRSRARGETGCLRP